MDNVRKPDELIYSQLEYTLSAIDTCTDSYIFIYDLKNDCYSISPSAVKRFPLPKEKFNNVSDVLKSVIHPDDYETINTNLKEISERKTSHHNFEYRWKNTEGDYIWISCRGYVITNNNDEALYLIGRISEIGALKLADNITGLLTDVQLSRDYKYYMSKDIKPCGYLMRLKIDNFKEINRCYGKTRGNSVLKIFAKILQEESFFNQTRAYRYENSNFILFNHSGKKASDAIAAYENIKRAVEKATEENEYKTFFTVSAGIVEIPEKNPPEEIEDLYKKAEYAIYRASKDDISSNAFIFNEDDYKEYIRRLEIQENMRIDIKDNFKNFELYYQPVISLENHKVVGAEALLRWNNEKFGRIYPSDFIPILEESGLIVPLGKWILKTAITQCKQWQKYIPHFKMNINVSYVQLRNSDILTDIGNYITEIDIDPKYIVIEVTESGHLDMNTEIIKGLFERNFKLAIDDFGTGYSNMRYLQYLNVNILKIDRSFVERASRNEYDYKIVQHIIDMAHSIDLEVCLEGIETDEELQTFTSLNPNFIQGFHFGRPVPKDVFYETNIKPHIDSEPIIAKQ